MLDALGAEVELCVSRMASIFPDARSKLIFLINNYDMLLGVISLNKKHDDASNSVYRFDSALRAVESEFVGQAVKAWVDITKKLISNLKYFRQSKI